MGHCFSGILFSTPGWCKSCPCRKHSTLFLSYCDCQKKTILSRYSVCCLRFCMPMLLRSLTCRSSPYLLKINAWSVSTCIYIFFFSHFYFPASGQAVVTGVVPSPPRFLPAIFIAHRVQQSHYSSIFHRVLSLTHALALSASQFVHKKRSQRSYTSMHSAGLELTKLTYTRLEDNLIRHRGDRYTSAVHTRHWQVFIGQMRFFEERGGVIDCVLRRSNLECAH